MPRETATKVDYENFIQAQYPVISQTHLDELAKLYPVGQQFPDAGEYWHCTSTAYGELRYVCPGIYLSNMYSLYNVKGNYNYRYVALQAVGDGGCYKVSHEFQVQYC